MPSSEPAGPESPREINDDWIREHYPRIHRAAWLMTGDAWEAEDLAQETFVVALDRWKQFEGRSSAATWLYGILVRLHRRHRRALGRMRRRLTQYVQQGEHLERSTAQSENPQSRLAEQQWRDSVWADVARLPAAQQIAVTLRFAEGLSYEQIAETVGCACGTAKSRVHHGLRRLRDRLGGDVFASEIAGDEPGEVDDVERSEREAPVTAAVPTEVSQ